MQILRFHLGYASLDDDEFYGSEIAMINLAKQLKEYYDVGIYSDKCLKPREIDGIKYMRGSDGFETEEIDILIISRYPYLFIDYVIKAKKVYFWMHDLTTCAYYNGNLIKNHGKAILINNLDKIQKFIVLTNFHKEVAILNYGISDDKFIIIGNGINTELFEGGIKIPYRFIWTSSPKRGLTEILNMFPKIREKYKKAELYIYRGDHEMEQTQKDLMKTTEGVFYEGNKNNEYIAEQFKKSEIWLYPTDFFETYCITALEAQMSGCLCITTPKGALIETVGIRGVLIDNKNTDPDYTRKVMETLEVFYNSDLYDRKIEMGKEWAKKQDWKIIAQEWLNLFDFFKERNLIIS